MKLTDITNAERAVQRALIAAKTLGVSPDDAKPFQDAKEILQEVRHAAVCLADFKSGDVPRGGFESNEIETRLMEFIRAGLWAQDSSKHGKRVRRAPPPTDEQLLAAMGPCGK